MMMLTTTPMPPKVAISPMSLVTAALASEKHAREPTNGRGRRCRSLHGAAVDRRSGICTRRGAGAVERARLEIA